MSMIIVKYNNDETTEKMQKFFFIQMYEDLVLYSERGISIKKKAR
jgi:hypothetical protein